MLKPSDETLEQVRQLRELEAQYPVPIWAEVMADWKWVRALMADGSIDPENRYAGQHIAVLNQEIIGHGDNPLLLRVTMARKLGIHPERLVLTYLNEA
jgi:Family of unknown function (DUF5678)